MTTKPSSHQADHRPRLRHAQLAATGLAKRTAGVSIALFATSTVQLLLTPSAQAQALVRVPRPAVPIGTHNIAQTPTTAPAPAPEPPKAPAPEADGTGQPPIQAEQPTEPTEPEDDGFVIEASPDDFEDTNDAEIEGGEFTIEAAPEAEQSDDSEEFEEVPEADDEFDDEGFTFEDISDDPEALAAEFSGGENQADGIVGTIRGKVESSDGAPILGAFIELVGTDFLARSGVDGTFELKVPPGVHSVEISMDGYTGRVVSDFEVEAEQEYSLDARLKPLEGASITLEVEGELDEETDAAQLIIRKQDTQVRDIMSAKEIAKSGGSSAGSVAKRMVATTLIGGRYVFVRGLGHRYGNTLFDKARVPSPDPDLRTVPLDIFPAAALSAINVQKTFSPDVPGDFSGASIQLESRPIPKEPFFSVSASLGLNTETTFQDMMSNNGFKGADAFAFGNTKRGLPGNFPSDDPVVAGISDANFQQIWQPEDIEKWGDRVYSDIEIIRDRKAPANFGAKIAYGQGWDLKRDLRIGTILAAGYANAHQTRHETVRVFGVTVDENGVGTPDTDTPQVDYNSFKTTNNVAWNALGQVGLEVKDDHEIDALVLYSRDADDETRWMRGKLRSASGENEIISTRLRYTVRSLLLSRLGSKHNFNDKFELDWFASLSQARRADPALRQAVYTEGGAEQKFRLDTSAGAASTQLYMDLVDNTRSGAVDMRVPFKQWGKLDSKLSFGGWAEDKQREFTVRRFSYFVATDYEDNVPTGFGDLINADTIGNGLREGQGGTGTYFLKEETRALDNYRGRQSIFAGYAKIDLPVTHWLKLSGGARYEKNIIDVEPYNPFADGKSAGSKSEAQVKADKEAEKRRRASLNDNNILPAVSFIFSLPKDMKIRLAGTRTVARPELRELAPFTFTDFVGGFDVQGNPNLVSTRIWNTDLRWEWFPSVGEVFAATLFYKYFDAPIESVVAARAGGGLSSFRNAKSAYNVGFELEFRKNFGFISEKLSGMSIGANYAFIHSRVTLPDPVECDPEADPEAFKECSDLQGFDISTSRERPLQGQAPHVLNAYFDFDLKKTGTALRLLYNLVGRKVHRVSGLGAPDIYADTTQGLDLTASQVLWPPPGRGGDDDLENKNGPKSELKLSLGAKNLLNYPIRYVQGDNDEVTFEVRTGPSFSVSLGWSF